MGMRSGRAHVLTPVTPRYLPPPPTRRPSDLRLQEGPVVLHHRIGQGRRVAVVGPAPIQDLSDGNEIWKSTRLNSSHPPISPPSPYTTPFRSAFAGRPGSSSPSDRSGAPGSCSRASPDPGSFGWE